MVDEVKTNEDCIKYIFKDDMPKIQKAFHKHIQDKKDFIVTHRIVTGDNHSKYIEQRCETTFDDEGNALVSVGTAQDISERKFLEKQLLEQVRLAQMGEMISMIAHQWRQPLNAISSTSTALNLKAEFNDLDKKFVIKSTNNISRYSQHLSNTIDDFRDFFKVNKEKKSIKYNDIINNVLNIVETSVLNKNILIKKELNSDIEFYTYSSELKQVILNLIKNAEDILLEKNIENPWIKIQTNNNILKISDNGGGVPTDIIDSIFDPYFSTKLKKDGTGLGLYMSKTIIEEHCSGTLTVSNDENGAIFTIELKQENNNG
jgi:signal transduction histidine kinase